MGFVGFLGVIGGDGFVCNPPPATIQLIRCSANLTVLGRGAGSPPNCAVSQSPPTQPPPPPQPPQLLPPWPPWPPPPRPLKKVPVAI